MPDYEYIHREMQKSGVTLNLLWLEYCETCRGVTRILQCDNLKIGVDKHGKNEIRLNKSYAELAEHYNAAIVPCRVRSPKDKAIVKGTVGVISTFILAVLRNQRFLSVRELNEAIQERLYEFNHKPFQKKDGSRASAFEEERAFLMPLPSRPHRSTGDGSRPLKK